MAKRRSGGRPPARRGPRAAPATRRSRAWRWALLPVLLAAAVHLNGLANPFVYDDALVVLRNPALHGLGGWKWLLAFHRFRPLVNLSFALDFAVGGAQPFGFHLTSLLLHVVCVALLFSWARALAGDLRQRGESGERGAPPAQPLFVAIATATLFAVHPLLTEAVGYASARAEPLGAALVLAALLLGRAAVRGRRGLWAPAGICWLLALAASEAATVAPLALLAWERLRAADADAGDAGDAGERDGADLGAAGALDASPVAPRHPAVLAPGLLALALLALGARVALYLRFESAGPPLARLGVDVASGVVEGWRYLGLLLAPQRQSIFHPQTQLASLLDRHVLLGTVALLALAAACWLLRRALPLVVYGALWFPLFLAPGALVRGAGPMAEHRLYLASAGAFLAFAALVAHLASAWRRLGLAPRLVEVLLVVLVAVLCLRTLQRNEVWSDPVALWDDAARQTPAAWAPHYALGEALRARGDCGDAVAVYRRAIALQPRDSRARVNLAGCLVQLGRPGEARVELESALEVDPRSADAHNDLGMLDLQAHQPRAALLHFQRAVQLDPQHVGSRLNLAALFERGLRRPDVALRLCEEAERIQPGLPAVADCIARNRRAAARNLKP